jgi:hypothetical protein
MQISKKQKNALIRELDSFARANHPLPSAKPKPKRQGGKQKRRSQGGRAPGSSMTGARSMSYGTGVSMQQDSQIPLTGAFSGSESLGSINGSVAFTETQFPINPGQAVMFPRESQEAKLWEMYEFDELAFEFRTAINQFATNAYGRVTVGVDFDASDPAPATLSQAEISRPVAAGLPYESIFLRLRKSDMNGWMKRHFVRPGNLPGAADIKMYDIGVLNVGTQGNVNANAIGELWVHFRGRYYNQVLESTSSAPMNNSVSTFADTPSLAITSTVTKQHTFTAATNINGLNAVNTAGSIVLPAGNYAFSAFSEDTFSTSGTSIFLELQQNGVALGDGLGYSQVTLGAAAVCTVFTSTITGYFVSTGLPASAITLVTNDTFTGTGSSVAGLTIWAV